MDCTDAEDAVTAARSVSQELGLLDDQLPYHGAHIFLQMIILHYE
jgi:hypothetical protein